MKYRTKPVEIRAHQWDGTFDSYRRIAYLIGKEYVRHAENEPWEIEVYNAETKTWFPVFRSHFVILHASHEVSTCDPTRFEEKYEIAFAKGGVTSATR